MSTAAPPPASISSLPGELLGYLLELVLEEEYEEARSRFLLRVTLVNRAWHVEAQRLLWRSVTLSTRSRAFDFMEQLDKSDEKWRTKSLVVSGEGRWQETDLGRFTGVRPTLRSSLTATEAWQIADKLDRGLAQLHIHEFPRKTMLPWDILCSESLRNLEVLKISDTFLCDPYRPPTTHFSLKSLHLINYASDTNTPYSLFSSSRLQRLRIFNTFWEVVDDSQLPDFHCFFNSVASTLTYFHLHQREFPSGMLPAFAACTSLLDLGIGCGPDELQTIIRSLPSQLQYLKLYYLTGDKYVSVLRPLTKVASLARLDILRFNFRETEWSAWAEEMDQEDWDLRKERLDFVAALEKQRITVLFRYDEPLFFDM